MRDADENGNHGDNITSSRNQVAIKDVLITFHFCSLFTVRSHLQFAEATEMSVRVRETTGKPIPFQPALSRSEAAEAARRRIDDPAHRVEVGPPARPGRRRPIRPGATSRRVRETLRRWVGVRGGDCRASPTEVIVEKPRTIITRNNSPDISFDRSINPYRGCEHGCSYCFARPTPRLPGPVPGSRFRDQDLRQAQRAGASGEGAAAPRATSRRTIAHRLEHRSLSAGGAALPHHAPHPRGAEPDQSSRSAS